MIFKKPYDDERLVYDKKAHIYLLAPEAVPNNVYRNDAIKNMKIRSLSNSLYAWIYNRVPLQNKDYVEYILACTEEYRTAIFNALTECYMAETISNYSSGKYDYQGNDKLMLDKLIPITARQAIQNGSSELNILYQGYFNVEMPEDRYIRYDY